MDRQAVIEVLRAREGEPQRRGVRHAALSGSVARGEAGASRDLGGMTEIDETMTGDVDAYGGLVGVIAHLLPVPAAVAIRAMLKPHVRPSAGRAAIHAARA